MTDSFEICDAKEKDFEAIACLANENELLLDGLTTSIFHRMLKWLHSKSDDGMAVQIIARTSSRLIAHYGGIKYDMRWYGKKISAIFASNLVIDKKYRKHSPFFLLQKRFIQDYQLKGYSFAYGAITRKGVLNPHIRMGWKTLGSLNVYVRPISLNLILRKIVKNKLILGSAKFPLQLIQRLWDIIFILNKTNIEVTEKKVFDNTISTQLEEWMNKKKICSDRTIEILNWRFCSFRDRSYRIFFSYTDLVPTGYMVVRLMSMKNFLCIAIVDLAIFNEEKKVFDALMRKCIDLAKESKIDLVTTAITDHDENRSNLIRSGFFKSKEKFTIVGHFAKNTDIKYSSFNFSHLHINWFDHDYV